MCLCVCVCVTLCVCVCDSHSRGFTLSHYCCAVFRNCMCVYAYADGDDFSLTVCSLTQIYCRPVPALLLLCWDWSLCVIRACVYVYVCVTGYRWPKHISACMLHVCSGYVEYAFRLI